MNHTIARAIRRKFHLKVDGHTLPIPASRRRTRLHLCEVWGELGYKRGVEIGVAIAGFSKEILDRVPEAHLTCIDPWCEYKDSFLTAEKQEGYYQQALERLTPYIQANRCEILRMPSLDALAKFEDESLDFVYIDGDHSFDYVVQELIYWTKKVKVGGMVALHDYMPMVRGGVRQAVDAYTYCHQIAPWYVICEDLPTAFWVKE